MKTNRTFRKIASAATAAILASCAMMPMAVTNVEATSTITIKNAQTDGHEYVVYQIFKGTLSNDGKLSDIKWGDGVSADIQTKVQGIPAFSLCTSAEAVAEKLATASTTDVDEFVKVVGANLGQTTSHTPTKSGSGTNYTYTLTIDKKDAQNNDISNGYYLVKNANNDLAGVYDAHTNYIVEVAGTGEAEVKTALPSIEKKVQDINDSEDNDVKADLLDSADYDIGDLVPFTITGSLPSNYATYSKYKYVITDTLSKGLKYDKDNAAVNVTVGGVEVSVDPTAKVNDDGTTTLTFTIDDLKTLASGATKNSKVIVKYNAVLDTDAVIGSAGNPNTVNLQYSNDPYETDAEPSLGKTPDDVVKVFTYKTIIEKVKEDETTKLQGAGFTLYKYDYNTAQSKFEWVQVKKIAASTITDFEFIGLDDGKYKLVEDTAPSGYNKLQDAVYFEISATHGTELTNLTATQRKCTNDADATFADFGTGAIDFSESVADGSITAKVENKSGSVLPSTGGIGTTPFYIGGGVLVAAAGVYIIVRKRIKHSNDDEK